MNRKVEINRKTSETDIKLSLELDGSGSFSGKSGIGFFDHMLQLFSRHALFDLELETSGDLEVDGHHTLEDIGIVLGQALKKALGDKKSINRYGSFLLPMDEALVMVALDFSGRPLLDFQMEIPSTKIGELESELVEEFLRSLVNQAGLTLHIRQLAGKNAHHLVEALFKGLGRALREAVSLDPRENGIPSSKGSL